MTLAARVEREAESIAEFVRTSRDRRLAYALFDQEETPHKTADHVQNRLEIPLRIVDLGAAGGRLDETIARLRKRSCVFVLASDESIETYLPEIRQNAAVLRKAAHAVVFWVSEAGFRRLSQGAPEFAKLRLGLFDLREKSLPWNGESLGSNSLAARDMAEMRARADACQEQLRVETDPAKRADIANRLGFTLAVLRQYGEAARALRESLALARRIGDKPLQADNLFLLGQTALFQDRLIRARVLLDASTKLTGGHCDAGLHWALSSLAIRQQDLTRAVAHAEASVSQSRKEQDQEGLALGLRQLAQCHVVSEQWNEAVSALREVLSMPAEAVGVRERALAEWQLAEVAARRGDPWEGEQQMLRAVRALRDSQDSDSQALAWCRLGQLAEQRGDYQTAAERLEEAMWLWREAGREDCALILEQRLRDLAPLRAGQSALAAGA